MKKMLNIITQVLFILGCSVIILLGTAAIVMIILFIVVER